MDTFTEFYADWSGWKSLKPETKNVLKTFLSSNESSMTFTNLGDKNAIRKEIHQIAELFGLQTHSEGERTNRTIVISKPSTFEPSTPRTVNIETYKKKKDKERGRAIRHDRFEKWVNSKYCEECGAKYPDDLGYARDGTVLCLDCYENDEELSNYKWESLESCFV